MAQASGDWLRDWRTQKVWFVFPIVTANQYFSIICANKKITSCFGPWVASIQIWELPSFFKVVDLRVDQIENGFFLFVCSDLQINESWRASYEHWACRHITWIVRKLKWDFIIAIDSSFHADLLLSQAFAVFPLPQHYGQIWLPCQSYDQAVIFWIKSACEDFLAHV